jgi:Zn-dependent protease with chaperone function
MFIMTIIYLFLDLFFGFTVATLVKDCKDISTLEEFSLHKKLFDETLNEFDMDDVKFLLQESQEVNAFAVLTLRKKYVVVTTAMLNHLTNSFPNIEEQKLAIKGMIAHELSHLLNWDSLPNLILLSGQNIAYYLSTALNFVLNIILLILSYIPITAIFSFIVRIAFNLLQLGLNLVYTYVLHPTYLLVERF